MCGDNPDDENPVLNWELYADEAREIYRLLNLPAAPALTDERDAAYRCTNAIADYLSSPLLSFERDFIEDTIRAALAPAPPPSSPAEPPEAQTVAIRDKPVTSDPTYYRVFHPAAPGLREIHSSRLDPLVLRSDYEAMRDYARAQTAALAAARAECERLKAALAERDADPDDEGYGEMRPDGE